MTGSMRRKPLDQAILAALTSLLPGMATAQVQQEPEQGQASTPARPANTGLMQCSATACQDGGEVLFELRTRSEERPLSGADSDAASSEVLQPDRRVDIGLHQPGGVTVSAAQVVEFPAGGVVWASEDPTLGQRALAASLPGLVAFEQGRIQQPLSIHVRSNYPAFIDRQEVMIFRETDADLVRPLARIPVPVAAVGSLQWDGQLETRGGPPLRQGDGLVYVLRAYGHNGQYDQTHAQSFRLVSPEEMQQARLMQQERLQKSTGVAMTEAQAQERSLIEAVFAEAGLRYQNIPLNGSRIRLHGQDIASNRQLRINGAAYPVDMERKFAADFLVPVGRHRFDVEIGDDNEAISRRLEVDVTGKYLFAVGMADISLGRDSISGSPSKPSGSEDWNPNDEAITRGRLAFYAKSRIKGRYLLTGHVDTTDKELDHILSGLTETTPEDLFRRLDPDMYYPVYGDDSTTWRDVDTQGRMYFRMDWDLSTALWGNYNAGLTGTEFAQYQRGLYGAALDWRSVQSTAWGDAGTTVKAFAAQPDTLQGRSEFVGTGGSLYYLRHTDILPGSERVLLHVLDRTTGRIEAQQVLQRGADYEIDEMQGRIILTVPLAQQTRRHLPTLSRDAALDGYEQRLLVDYAWVPAGLDRQSTTFGGRAKHWFGDHLALGVTHVQEGRQGNDYQLDGVDVTLQAGQGTWLRAEMARTESFGVPVYWSANGGLDFQLRNRLDDQRQGDARSVEGRINLQELGWTEGDWSAAAWWRDREAGYSTGLYDSSVDVRETGVEIKGQLAPQWQIYLRASEAEGGNEAFEQAQATVSWLRNERTTTSLDLRKVDETNGGGSAAGTLLAGRWQQQIGDGAQLYVEAQKTLDDDDGRYAANDAVAVGGQFQLADRFTLGGEMATGDRGDALQAQVDYRLSDGHNLYGGYTYSTDTVTPSLLRPRRNDNGWTLGQRWRLGSQTMVFNESQMLRQDSESGLVHTFGLDFFPGAGWRSGITLSKGELENGQGRLIDRNAVSLSAGRTDPRTDWSSKLEWRRDTGAEEREQWVTTHRLTHRLNDDWRLAARVNWADTNDRWDRRADARFAEANVGVAWRPHDGQRWALLARYTYLQDLATLGQLGGAQVDQKSHVLSAEGIYKHDQRWEYVLKLARREGEVRLERGQGPWLDSATTFIAGQVRYDIWNAWHGLAEYRILDVDKGGRRSGALVALERDIGPNLRIGGGYNFTDFSDDLTDFDYRQRGWFFSLTGIY